jgi:hypothetical protein
MDRGYDSDGLRKQLRRQGIEPIVPHRKGRRKPPMPDGRALRRYKRRWIIERTFTWRGNFRRLICALRPLADPIVGSFISPASCLQRTISRWMKRALKLPDPAKRWVAFLRNHREAIAAMDFFAVPSITFGVSTASLSSVTIGGASCTSTPRSIRRVGGSSSSCGRRFLLGPLPGF